tara:strand:- start:162 stop:728 length:567 start_codon:yes stop_codon:yes gene_type:complete
MAFERQYKNSTITIKAGDYPNYTEKQLWDLSGCAPDRWIEYDGEVEVIVTKEVRDPETNSIITPAVMGTEPARLWRFMNNAELKALEAEEAEAKKAASKKALREACERYQNFPGGCNHNFFSLITTIRGVAKATNTEVPPKAKACLDWLDALWSIYYTREAAGDYNHDFSEAGFIPYGFTEVRAESEG